MQWGTASMLRAFPEVLPKRPSRAKNARQLADRVVSQNQGPCGDPRHIG